MKFTGKVVSTKIADTHYGPTLKTLVETDAGYKLWGTVPSKLGTPQHDDRVTIEAAVTPSKDDPKFGFFGRPKVMSC